MPWACLAAAAMLALPGSATEDPARIGLSPSALLAGAGERVLGEVDIQSSNVYDYTFANAPTDWVPTGGSWKQMNRWTCSPQWSWFGGYERAGLAALWNKRVFAGDIVLEVYASFKMGGATPGGSGEEARDLNFTLHGNGRDLDSGYSFILGGYGNTVTCIMRGTKVLAETQDPQNLLPTPDGSHGTARNIHNEWEAVRACLHGNHLSLYHNEQLVLEADDPEPPLPAGRPAIWTMDNGILLSRVKVYFAQEVPRTSL